MRLHLPPLLGSTHPEPPVDVGVVCLDGICSSSMLGAVRRHVRPRAVSPRRLDVASWEHGPALRGGAVPKALVDLILCQGLRLATGGRRLRGRGCSGGDWEWRRGGGGGAKGVSGHFRRSSKPWRRTRSVIDDVKGGLVAGRLQVSRGAIRIYIFIRISHYRSPDRSRTRSGFSATTHFLAIS